MQIEWALNKINETYFPSLRYIFMKNKIIAFSYINYSQEFAKLISSASLNFSGMVTEKMFQKEAETGQLSILNAHKLIESIIKEQPIFILVTLQKLGIVPKSLPAKLNITIKFEASYSDLRLYEISFDNMPGSFLLQLAQYEKSAPPKYHRRPDGSYYSAKEEFSNLSIMNASLPEHVPAPGVCTEIKSSLGTYQAFTTSMLSDHDGTYLVYYNKELRVTSSLSSPIHWQMTMGNMEDFITEMIYLLLKLYKDTGKFLVPCLYSGDLMIQRIDPGDFFANTPLFNLDGSKLRTANFNPKNNLAFTSAKVLINTTPDMVMRALFYEPQVVNTDINYLTGTQYVPIHHDIMIAAICNALIRLNIDPKKWLNLYLNYKGEFADMPFILKAVSTALDKATKGQDLHYYPSAN